MSRVRSKNTTPEMVVRKLVHSMGYRYRLHSAGLPGHPDLVFPARRKVIFVHGCFWHKHARCSNVRLPKTNAEYWEPKLEGNRQRDKKHIRRLAALGWQALVVWECQAQDSEALASRIRAFLDGGQSVA